MNNNDYDDKSGSALARGITEETSEQNLREREVRNNINEPDSSQMTEESGSVPA